ncbi:MAG: hypothetical protein JST04_08875 [Bdellovibrionales bacterium]|nr:hypothetical protein [Bdellovibrionales bacterium]
MSRVLILSALTFLAAISAYSNEEEAEIEIGPDKGITELAPDKSFKLSPEAKQTFAIRTVAQSANTFSVPNTAIVNARTESQLFRLRDGFYKPIHFKFLKQGDQMATVQTTELKAGDEVVVQGVGFLRIVAAQLGEKENAESPESNSKASAVPTEKGADHD